jgi:hypothetical protein
MKPKSSSRVNWRPVDDKPKAKEERVAVKRRDPAPEPAPAAKALKPKRAVRKVKKEVPPAPVAAKKKPIKRTGQVVLDKAPKKAKKAKENLFVIHESDTKKTRVVLLLSPAEGDRQEMIGIRQQFRREGQEEWQFAKTGVSMISDVEILRALRDGCDALIEVMESK